MTEVLYWHQEAEKFKEYAQVADDQTQQAELLEFAEACEAVAVSVEYRGVIG